MANDNAVEQVRVNFFALSEDCMYSFKEELLLYVLHSRKENKRIVVNREFDLLFIGVGDDRDQALADWKMKFHYFSSGFQDGGLATRLRIKSSGL